LELFQNREYDKDDCEVPSGCLYDSSFGDLFFNDINRENCDGTLTVQDCGQEPTNLACICGEELAPTKSPTKSPTLSGDPHLVGLLGQKFDLMGKPHTSYDFVSDNRLQMIVRIHTPLFEHSSDARLRASSEHAGLFMIGVDVAYLDENGSAHQVSLLGDFNSTVRHHERHCDGLNTEKGSCLRGMQVHVNGDRVTSTSTVAAVGKGAALKLENNVCPFNMRDGSCKTKATNGGHGLATLVTPSVVLQVGAAFMNNHELNQRAVHHLDLAISEYHPSGKPGGLVGQTVEFRYGPDGKPIMEGAGSIEGVEDDYIVSGLDAAKLKGSPFSKDSAYSASADGAAADGSKQE
jgi:hypothetical protein